MRIEFYIDAANEHRWRAVADNNEVIATSSEGYRDLGDCQAGLVLLAQALRGSIAVDNVSVASGWVRGNLQALIEKYGAKVRESQ